MSELDRLANALLIELYRLDCGIAKRITIIAATKAIMLPYSVSACPEAVRRRRCRVRNVFIASSLLHRLTKRHDAFGELLNCVAASLFPVLAELVS